MPQSEHFRQFVCHFESTALKKYLSTILSWQPAHRGGGGDGPATSGWSGSRFSLGGWSKCWRWWWLSWSIAASSSLTLSSILSGEGKVQADEPLESTADKERSLMLVYVLLVWFYLLFSFSLFQEMNISFPTPINHDLTRKTPIARSLFLGRTSLPAEGKLESSQQQLTIATQRRQERPKAKHAGKVRRNRRRPSCPFSARFSLPEERGEKRRKQVAVRDRRQGGAATASGVAKTRCALSPRVDRTSR